MRRRLLGSIITFICIIITAQGQRWAISLKQYTQNCNEEKDRFTCLIYQFKHPLQQVRGMRNKDEYVVKHHHHDKVRGGVIATTINMMNGMVVLGGERGQTKYHLGTSFMLSLSPFPSFSLTISATIHTNMHGQQVMIVKNGEQQKRTLCLSSVTGQPLISLPSYPQS